MMKEYTEKLLAEYDARIAYARQRRVHKRPVVRDMPGLLPQHRCLALGANYGRLAIGAEGCFRAYVPGFK